MPYDYMQDIFDLLKLNQQQPNMTQLTNPQQPQEPLNGQQIVDTKMAEAIAPRPAPNPYQIGLEQKIGAQKAIWEAANDTLNNNLATYAKTNRLTEDAARAMLGAQQQNAHDAAESFRNQLTASGFGTDGYSALGNSFADVQNQLATRQAQDIAEAFNGGAYSMTTDQYYDREFSKAIMSGLSPNRARDLASANARKYQANRVAYLDGLYNSWGRNEAGVTNPIGMQVLGMIAQDNPMLANLYAQVYPTPMNEYNTENEFAKQILQNDQAVNLLGIEQANALERILAELNANKDYATHNAGLTRETYAGNKAVDQKYWEAQEKYKQEHKDVKPSAVETALSEGLQLAAVNGLSGDQAILFVRDYASKKLIPRGKNQSNSSAEKLQYYNALLKEEKNIREQMTGIELSPKEQKDYQNRLRVIEDIINAVRNDITDNALGFSEEFSSYTGDSEKDLPIMASIIQYMTIHGASEDEIFGAVRDWVHKHDPDITDWAVQSMIGKARGN